MRSSVPRSGRYQLPLVRSLCFRCGEYHIMGPECWEWAARMTMKRPHLTGQELRDYQQEIAERRILDRFTRLGYI